MPATVLHEDAYLTVRLGRARFAKEPDAVVYLRPPTTWDDYLRQRIRNEIGKLQLIHEFPDSWKFDVPDQVDGRKLYDNLLTQLTAFDEHKDQWPADVNDAYRAASHHVLMALMDVPMGGQQQGVPGSGMDNNRMNRDTTGTGTSTGTGTGAGGGSR